jgi:putative radical SAM enzyme (TIGR03279 family)
MMDRNDLRVLSVGAAQPAANGGLQKGDVIVSVNGRPVKDEFDFRFHTACDTSRIIVRRKGTIVRLTVRRPANTALGVRFARTSVLRCANRCVFCFIDQMPRGLRKSLYVKDEDIGHSFANGNYVTLSTTPYDELDRIAGIGLSPLYVSVHATQNSVRRTMLGNRYAYDVMEQLRFLGKKGVSFHTQIVVCPGYNDGDVLRRSVTDLLSLRAGLLSIAVVPVGLTKHRTLPLDGVTVDNARSMIALVGPLGESDKKKHGGRRLFFADELFLNAGIPVPPRAYYEGYPQIENGVGLVRQLREEWKAVRRDLLSRKHGHAGGKAGRTLRVLLITSESAVGLLGRIAADLNLLVPGVHVDACPVKNGFFGGGVTVAGLLTGADIVRTVRECALRPDHIVVPRVVFNHQGHTLDGYSAARLETALAAPLSIVDSAAALASIPLFSI